jgi:NADPH-dependent curcumin reductase CurA
MSIANTYSNKAWHLVSRPSREQPAGPHNFRLVESSVAEPAEGQVLIRHLFLSLDPYMRGRMNDGKNYAAPQNLDETMVGGTVGEVVASRHPKFREGDRVVGMGGWQLYALSDGAGLRKLPADDSIPIEAYIGPAGMPGITAWVGTTQIIKPKAKETYVVSAATGAVGTVAGQLAKMAGARVVGIAGGPDKCRYAVDTLGLDACVDHRTADFEQQFAAATPDGIDGLFENVGGDPFKFSLRRINFHSRIALCGLVASGYDGTPTVVEDMRMVLTARCLIQGFIVTDFLPLWPQAIAELSGHLASGRIKWRTSIADGIEAAPEAFFAMLKGGNFGKQLVRLG